MTESKIRVRRRILMLIPELGYGGAEKSFLRLCRLLAEHHEVSIAVFKRNYAKGNYKCIDEHIDLPVNILDTNKNLNKFSRWLARWSKLRTLKKNKDVTISFLTGANILNIVTRCQDYKIISMRGSRRFDPAFTPIQRCLYEYLIDPITFRLSDRIISISEGLSSELASHTGRKTRSKIKTITLFVEAEDLIASANDPIEEEIEMMKDMPIIIAAGRMSPEKGFQHLIKVFAEIQRRIPNAKLIFIGDGPSHLTLINQCKTLDLPLSDGQSRVQESSVVFLGYRENPLRYFRIARLFVLSSLTEGFSNILLEALATGVNVVSCNCPWGPRSILWKSLKNINLPYPTEVPTQADYGTLMPRIDQDVYHNLWVEKLCTMLSDPNIGKSTAKLGPDRVREFDTGEVGCKWLDLIDSLCQNAQT